MKTLTKIVASLVTAGSFAVLTVCIWSSNNADPLAKQLITDVALFLHVAFLVGLMAEIDKLFK